MPRGPKKSSVSKRLLNAAKFVSLAQKGKGDANTYCMAHGQMLVAFNGIVACGTPIDEALECCPHTELFKAALDACEADGYQLTQVAHDRLVLRSGEFEASIPCSLGAGLSWPEPDALTAPAGDVLTNALMIAGVLVSDKAPTLVQSCVLLKSGSAIATDRRTVLQAWHGFDLPGSYLIPKQGITALIKAKKGLAGLGNSMNGETLTFHFNDGSWIRTQLYVDKIPDATEYLRLRADCELVDTPVDLFSAVASVLPFSADSKVLVDGRKVQSWPKSSIGAQQTEISGDMLPRIYPETLLALKDLMVEYDACNDKATYFFGPNVRGAICHEVYQTSPKQPFDINAICVGCGKRNIECDCIPF